MGFEFYLIGALAGALFKTSKPKHKRHPPKKKSSTRELRFLGRW